MLGQAFRIAITSNVRGTPSPGVYRVPILPVAAHKPQANARAMHTTYDTVNTSSPKTGGKGQIMIFLIGEK